MFALLPATVVRMTVLSTYAFALAEPTRRTWTVTRAVMRQVSSGQSTLTQTVGASLCERLPESFAAGAVTSFSIAGEDGVVVDGVGGVGAGVGVGAAVGVGGSVECGVGAKTGVESST